MKLRNLLSMFKVGETSEEQTKRFSDQRAEALDRAHDKLAVAKKLATACEMTVAVRHVMMFQHINADFAAREILDKYKVEDVQLLAKLAQDSAEAALKEWNEKP